MASHSSQQRVLRAVCAADLRDAWDGNVGFEGLRQAAQRLGANGNVTPLQAGVFLLEACAKAGIASYVVDYVHVICADPAVSTSSAEGMGLLDGELVRSWLQDATAKAQEEVLNMLRSGSDPGGRAAHYVAGLRVRVSVYQAACTALRTAGLGTKPVAADQLARLKQLASALCFVSERPGMLHTSGSRCTDFAALQADVARRRAALQRHGLHEQSMLQHAEQLFSTVQPGAAHYPPPSMAECLAAATAPAGKHASRGHGWSGLDRARAVLYAAWDCGWAPAGHHLHDQQQGGTTGQAPGVAADTASQELAQWLEVPHSVAAEWHAISRLEQQLGAHPTHRSAAAPGDGAAAAVAVLQGCAQPQRALYVAQLLRALGCQELALQQACRALSEGTSSAARTDSSIKLQEHVALLGTLAHLVEPAEARVLMHTLLRAHPASKRGQALELFLGVFVAWGHGAGNMPEVLQLPWSHEEEQVLLQRISKAEAGAYRNAHGVPDDVARLRQQLAVLEVASADASSMEDLPATGAAARAMAAAPRDEPTQSAGGPLAAATQNDVPAAPAQKAGPPGLFGFNSQPSSLGDASLKRHRAS